MKKPISITAAETSKTREDFKFHWASLLSLRTERTFTKWLVRSCGKSFLKLSAARNDTEEVYRLVAHIIRESLCFDSTAQKNPRQSSFGNPKLSLRFFKNRKIRNFVQGNLTVHLADSFRLVNRETEPLFG